MSCMHDFASRQGRTHGALRHLKKLPHARLLAEIAALTMHTPAKHSGRMQLLAPFPHPVRTAHSDNDESLNDLLDSSRKLDEGVSVAPPSESRRCLLVGCCARLEAFKQQPASVRAHLR